MLNARADVRLPSGAIAAGIRTGPSRHANPARLSSFLLHTKYLTKSNSALSDDPEITRAMQFIQSKLSSFFRRSGGGDDDHSECPDDECVYDHSNSAQKYKTPMFWT